MKKLISAVLAVFLAFSAAVAVSAAGGTVTLKSSASTVYLKNSFTVTATFTAGEAIGSLDASFSFDTDSLSCSGATVSISTGMANVSGGRILVSAYTATGVSSVTVTMTFVATAKGATSIRLTSSDISNVSEATIGSPTGSISVTIKEKNLSSDASLTGITVPNGCTLSPAFSKDVTNYSCTVPNTVTAFPLSASKSDKSASYRVDGSTSLSVGVNVRRVVVTAEDGTTRTYTITITRLGATTSQVTPTAPPVGTEPPAEEPTAAPVLTVNANGVDWTVSTFFDDSFLPQGFLKDDFDYQGVTVQSAFLGGVRLLCLVDGNGDGKMFIYDGETFTEYKYLISPASSYTVLSSGAEAPAFFTAATLELDGVTYPAWTTAGLDDRCFVLWCMNSAGERLFCVYNKTDGTLQRLSSTLLTEPAGDGAEHAGNATGFLALFSDVRSLRFLCIAAVSLVLLLAVLLLVMLCKKRTAPRDSDGDAEQEEPDDEDADQQVFPDTWGIESGPAAAAEEQPEQAENKENKEEEEEELQFSKDFFLRRPRE